MRCDGKHYDCVEQSDCLDCRSRSLAIELLTEAHMPLEKSDVVLLADDLLTVMYDARLDKYVNPPTTRAIFVHRLGGIGNLASYMKVLRIQAERKR